MSSRRIMIFDTTLRDGEQAPGIALQPDEKLEIGEQLERLGVDVIEAGFAASSPGDFEGVRAVARSARRVTVASLCRASDSDIDAAAASLADAPRSRLTMTLPIGKHSGRHAFSHACVAAGLDLDEDELVEAFALFKTRADQGGAVSINELLQEVTLS